MHLGFDDGSKGPFRANQYYPLFEIIERHMHMNLYVNEGQFQFHFFN